MTKNAEDPAAWARRALGKETSPTKAERKAEDRASKARIRNDVEAEVDQMMADVDFEYEREKGREMAERALATQRLVRANALGGPGKRPT